MENGDAAIAPPLCPSDLACDSADGVSLSVCLCCMESMEGYKNESKRRYMQQNCCGWTKIVSIRRGKEVLVVSVHEEIISSVLCMWMFVAVVV